MGAVLGADRMETLAEVATRVNFTYFKQLPEGSAVRVGGRLSTGAEGLPQLTTTDGGVLSIAGFANLMDDGVPGFVEVVGKKTGDSAVETAGVTSLGENVDVELWDEAIIWHTCLNSAPSSSHCRWYELSDGRLLVT